MPWSLMVFQQRNGRVDRLRAVADAAHRLPRDREREPDHPRRHPHPGGAGREGRAGPPQHRRSVGLHARLRHRGRGGDHPRRHRRRRGGGALRREAEPRRRRGRRAAGAVPRHEPRRRAAVRGAGAAPGAGVALRERPSPTAKRRCTGLREGDRALRFETDVTGTVLTLDAPDDLRRRFDQFPREGPARERPLRPDRRRQPHARRHRREPPRGIGVAARPLPVAPEPGGRGG